MPRSDKDLKEKLQHMLGKFPKEWGLKCDVLEEGSRLFFTIACGDGVFTTRAVTKEQFDSIANPHWFLRDMVRQSLIGMADFYLETTAC